MSPWPASLTSPSLHCLHCPDLHCLCCPSLRCLHCPSLHYLHRPMLLMSPWPALPAMPPACIVLALSCSPPVLYRTSATASPRPVSHITSFIVPHPLHHTLPPASCLASLCHHSPIIAFINSSCISEDLQLQAPWVQELIDDNNDDAVSSLGPRAGVGFCVAVVVALVVAIIVVVVVAMLSWPLMLRSSAMLLWLSLS